jgi:hypothetical protein
LCAQPCVFVVPLATPEAHKLVAPDDVAPPFDLHEYVFRVGALMEVVVKKFYVPVHAPDMIGSRTARSLYQMFMGAEDGATFEGQVIWSGQMQLHVEVRNMGGSLLQVDDVLNTMVRYPTVTQACGGPHGLPLVRTAARTSVVEIFSRIPPLTIWCSTLDGCARLRRVRSCILHTGNIASSP